MKKLLVLAMVAVLGASAFAGATVTADTTATLDAHGPVLFALNFGGDDVTVNGIDFKGVSVAMQYISYTDYNPSSSQNMTIIQNDAAISYSGSGGLYDSAANFGTYKMTTINLMNAEGYDSTKDYVIQYLVGDSYAIYQGLGTQPADWNIDIVVDAGTESYKHRTEGANNNVNTVYGIVVAETPEPATMALLGLGGLFLRRRKNA